MFGTNTCLFTAININSYKISLKVNKKDYTKT